MHLQISKGTHLQHSEPRHRHQHFHGWDRALRSHWDRSTALQLLPSAVYQVAGVRSKTLTRMTWHYTSKPNVTQDRQHLRTLTPPQLIPWTKQNELSHVNGLKRSESPQTTYSSCACFSFTLPTAPTPYGRARGLLRGKRAYKRPTLCLHSNISRLDPMPSLKKVLSIRSLHAEHEKMSGIHSVEQFGPQEQVLHRELAEYGRRRAMDGPYADNLE